MSRLDAIPAGGLNQAADETEIVVELDDAGATEAAADVVELGDEVAADALPARAVRNADGSITLPLLYPVALKFKKGTSGEVKEELFEELRMNRLTGADMRAITAASAGSLIVVAIARSARIPEVKMGALFDRMDGADASAASAVVSFFLTGGRPNGR